jgi:hypothetical protein
MNNRNNFPQQCYRRATTTIEILQLFYQYSYIKKLNDIKKGANSTLFNSFLS